MQLGHTLHLKCSANKRLARIEVVYLDTVYPGALDPEAAGLYECFVPTDCEEKSGDLTLVIRATDRTGAISEVPIILHALPFEIKKGAFVLSIWVRKLHRRKS